MNRYLNGMLTNEEVIQELLKLAKDIAAAAAEGEKLGLTAYCYHERTDSFASQKPDNRLAKERERKSWNAPPGQKVAEKTQISARGYG